MFIEYKEENKTVLTQFNSISLTEDFTIVNGVKFSTEVYPLIKKGIEEGRNIISIPHCPIRNKWTKGNPISDEKLKEEFYAKIPYMSEDSPQIMSEDCVRWALSQTGNNYANFDRSVAIIIMKDNPEEAARTLGFSTVGNYKIEMRKLIRRLKSL